MMKFLFGLLVVGLALASASGASAQQVVAPCVTTTVTSSGTTQLNCARVTATNPLPITGTISATIGGFTPSASGARGTPLTVTTSDSSGTLPTGTVVVVSNVGTTNPMYCNVNGVAATASDQLISANGGWFAFTIPAAVTTLRCIATGGSTTANMLGGSGIVTGTGGGSGGSSSSITTWAGGTLGAMANYGTSPGAVLVPGVNAFITNTPAVTVSGVATAANQATEIGSLATIASNTGASIPAGSAIIGYVSNDVCAYQVKTNLPISQNGTSSVQLVALSGSTVIYVCSLSLIAAGATTVAITTGTGSACVTGNAAVIGSTTANIANSMSFAANGGLTLGNGAGTIAKGAASSELCMILGSNVYVSGNLTYVQQ